MGQVQPGGGGVRSVQPGGGGVQVQLPGGGGGQVQLLGGGQVSLARGGQVQLPRGGSGPTGGGVSILRPLAGGMPLAFTQEDFLVIFCDG